jgi:hypothetical protein
VTGQSLSFRAAPPPDMAALLDLLGGQPGGSVSQGYRT